MNPGDTTRSFASTTSVAGAPASRPMATMRSPRTPMSCRIQGLPDPSSTRPLTMRMSNGTACGEAATTPPTSTARVATKGSRDMGRSSPYFPALVHQHFAVLVHQHFAVLVPQHFPALVHQHFPVLAPQHFPVFVHQETSRLCFRLVSVWINYVKT